MKSIIKSIKRTITSATWKYFTQIDWGVKYNELMDINQNLDDYSCDYVLKEIRDFKKLTRAIKQYVDDETAVISAEFGAEYKLICVSIQEKENHIIQMEKKILYRRNNEKEEHQHLL